MNVELTEDQQNYIQKQLDAGTYADANDVLLDALNLKIEQDAEEQAKIEALRAAFWEGENSGECEPQDMGAMIAEAKQEIDAQDYQASFGVKRF